ncbi:MAG TPA: hypothetical protein VMT89_05875, partial [Candidatus Acidoferrales bacterium]|nr:hypothetical protein [Candidatus Acidoferrales bacterium]
LDPGELYFSVSADKARTALKTAILKKCDNHGSGLIVPVADLGLNLIPACPSVGTALATDAAYNALIDCITHSADGDFASGKTFDWILRVFQRSIGTGVIRPHAKPGTADLDPRMLVQFNGSLVTQIGTVSPGLSDAAQSTAPGSLSAPALASCTTGNGRTACLNNADCGRASDGTTAGVCAANASTTCPSGGGSCRALTGSEPLKASGTEGETLALTPGCSGAVATCVRTVAKSAGNGTTASGGVDLTTGELFENLPISYEIYVTSVAADCSTFQPCGICSMGKCSAGPRVGLPCWADDGSVTIECPPPGSPTSTVFSPQYLSTEPKWMQVNPNGVFCGFCDVTATQNGSCDGDPASCAVGCAFSQWSGVNGDAECVAKLGPGHFCDFGSNKKGFRGDPNITLLSNDGERSQYAPLVTGLFCTGSSGNPTVDGAAGLPGPVQTRLPYINGFAFSKDK